MDSNNCKKRYMKYAQNSGCILADYNSIRDSEISIFVINNNAESGIYSNAKIVSNSTSDLQCQVEPYY